MEYRNDATGQVVGGHAVGTTEDGRTLYRVPDGYTPVGLYELVEPGLVVRARPEDGTVTRVAGSRAAADRARAAAATALRHLAASQDVQTASPVRGDAADVVNLLADEVESGTLLDGTSADAPTAAAAELRCVARLLGRASRRVIQGGPEVHLVDVLPAWTLAAEALRDAAHAAQRVADREDS